MTIKTKEKKDKRVKMRQKNELPILYIDTEKIMLNHMRVRADEEDSEIMPLADSIKQNGLVNPVSVRDISDKGGEECYELISGERRLRAYKLLGLEKIPCIMRKADMLDSAKLSLVENILRRDLGMFELATAFMRICDLYGISQSDLAASISVTQSFVSNKIRLLKFDKKEREQIVNAGLTERHARALLRIADTSLRAKILSDVIERGYNVRQTEDYVDRICGISHRNDEISTKYIIKDLRLFYNTVDKAVETMQKAGIDAKTTRTEKEDSIEILITIPKTPNPTVSTPEAI